MTSAALLAPVLDDLVAFARGRLAKAALPAGIAARDALVEPFTTALGEYFDAMADRVLGTVRKAVEIEWDPNDSVDWTVEDAELGKVLARWYLELGEAAYAGVADQLAIELRFDVHVSPAKEIVAQVGSRVVGINETSRELLGSAVERAIASGDSVDELRASLGELFDGWSASRAQTIALTETATVYNQATAAGYRDSGLVDEVEILDGDECGWDGHDDPDLANGSIRTVDEFEATPISHPNCQRAAAPVVTR